jgi:hypothetical protein
MFEARVQFPRPGGGEPTYWAIEEHALGVAHVTRDTVRTLGTSWRKPLGAYLLLGDLDTDGGFTAYAGSAYSAGLGVRVPRQMAKYPWCTHAFLLRREALPGFGSAHAAHLERLLFNLATQAPGCRRINENLPPEMPVTTAERRWLQDLLDPFIALAADHGYHLRPVAREVTAPATVTLRDLLSAGLLTPGERLFPRWKPAGISPAVLTETGDIEWNGDIYDGASPSAPARAAREGRKTNAWQYYVVIRGGGRVPLEVIREGFRSGLRAA